MGFFRVKIPTDKKTLSVASQGGRTDIGSQFTSCWLKVGRADEHIRMFKEEVLAWKESGPYEPIREKSPDGGEHWVRVHMVKAPDLDRWALIASDCLHNLRSALDQSLYAVALCQDNVKPPDDARNLQFPICDDKTLFGKLSWRIKSLSAGVQGVIESVQPYNRPHTNLPLPILSLLRDFDNWDKHRLLNVVLAHHIGGTLSIKICDPTVKPFDIWYHQGSIEDGTTIVRFSIFPPNPDLDYKHEASIVLAILHRARPIELIALLEFLSAEVKIIVNKIGAVL